MVNVDGKGVVRRIEMRIAELGMSKEEFYKLSGISSASYSQWNTERHKPTEKKLYAAAKVLKVSVEYLLTGNDEQKEKPAPINGDELEQEFIRLIRLCSPEQIERELAYLRSLVNEKDM